MPFKEDAVAIDEHPLSGPELNGAEPEPLMHGMHDGIAQLQPHLELVKIRRLGGPEPRMSDRLGKMGGCIEGHILHGNRIADGFPAQIEHLHLDRIGRATGGCRARVRQRNVDIEGPGRSGVDGQAIDKGLGNGLQIYRPEDATIVPEIPATLGVIDRLIHGVVVNVHLDFILLAGRLEQARDVVLKRVIAPLVQGAC